MYTYTYIPKVYIILLLRDFKKQKVDRPPPPPPPTSHFPNKNKSLQGQERYPNNIEENELR